MNATNTTPGTRSLRLAPPSNLKLVTCAALSLIITLLSASVIGQATGTRSLSSASAPALTASLR